jgi:hypothetical protein
MKTDEAIKRATQAGIRAVIDVSRRLRWDRDWEAVITHVVEVVAPILLAAKNEEIARLEAEVQDCQTFIEELQAHARDPQGTA